jgi:hypothetical protein
MMHLRFPRKPEDSGHLLLQSRLPKAIACAVHSQMAPQTPVGQPKRSSEDKSRTKGKAH